MTTWQSNDDVRRDGGAEVAEFDDAPPAPADERAEPDGSDDEPGVPADPQDPRLLEQYPDAADLPEPDAPSRRMEGERDGTPHE
jgi:hypothetical protein